MIKFDGIETKTPKTWNELQAMLFGEHDINIDRFRSNFAYRGVSNSSYGLETSLQRLGRKPSEVESHLIRNFQKYSPINTLVDEYNNIWNWLSLGQHHGLPTRLLDWTFSPNVALHFMTDDIKTFDKEGVIWMVDFVEMKNQLPKELTSALDHRRVLSFSTHELKTILGNSVETLENLKKSSSNSKSKNNAIVFFEPPSIDDRIVNQFALFSFMLDPDSDKLEYLKNHPKLFKRILINPELKWEIRDKLDQANITERIIYPGLDGISKWMQRWYSEKDETKKWKL